MNQLHKETSPYLLQHAHNPVNWYAWKPEALEKAKREDKPILVSIGYSTCHWCHVMERESFENEEVAAFMNEHFINIKVDREERPDVDQIYMEACQAVSGSGGWPLNCFLLPDGRPFYAGTYFPPRNAHNRPSWMQVLKNIYQAFYEKRSEVEGQAERLMSYIERADTHLLGNEIDGLETDQRFTPVLMDNIFFQLQKNFDTEEGGFGGAPKFPGSMSIQFLLEYYQKTNRVEAKEHALFSLNQMIYGGIYDQIGGGFARYATDRAWLVPHFEKMLYDNALLVSVLSDAYKLTKSELYKTTIGETLTFIEREMTSPEHGFYAALDADSEGIEGKFYVWDQQEILDVLGEEGALFAAFYGVTKAGNWEGHNILNRSYSFEDFAQRQGITDIPAFKRYVQTSNHKLLKARAKRIRPGLDDKILLSWNALMCTAYAKAYQATQKENYKSIMLQNIDFLLAKMIKEDSVSLYHTYKEGVQQYDGFLEDYAFLIEALLTVYQTIFDTTYLQKAKILTDHVIEQFLDESVGLFYFTTANQSDIVMRKKEIYDSATPSGNSTMLHNLQKLAILFGNQNYAALTDRMLEKVVSTAERYPSSFSRWSSAMLARSYSYREIAVVGENAPALAAEINTLFLSNTIIMSSQTAVNDYPLLKDRYQKNETYIYLCSNYTCQKPVKTVDELLELL